MTGQKFIKISESFFVDAGFQEAFEKSSLTCIDDVFSFSDGRNLHKADLAGHRSRLQFDINSPLATLFLKRYDRPPILVQLKNWLCHHKRRATAFFDVDPAEKLAAAGIKTPKTICYGWQWTGVFEKRSFCVTEKIQNAESLEQKLPPCFAAEPTAENSGLRKKFIEQLAAFIKKFHQTNYRHRDLYLCHIFKDDNDDFHLIDLARAFKPTLFRRRFTIKDIAQLYYSAPAASFSKTDRLRFYLAYIGSDSLTKKDKIFIAKVKNKAKAMARHDIKHQRTAPFAN